MDESLKCECGEICFWYFWDRVRCPRCLNEYKRTETLMENFLITQEHKFLSEYWLRRFNNETKQYSNWEKAK